MFRRSTLAVRAGEGSSTEMKSVAKACMVAMMAAAFSLHAQQTTHHWVIVVHGGAGVIERATMSPETEARLSRLSRAGGNSRGQGACRWRLGAQCRRDHHQHLEDDPLFNAGRGASFSAEGKNELDSSIMDGSNLKAGAVCGVTRTRHPISLARAVMEKSPYVMLCGAGADAFAAQAGLEQVDPSFFFTERTWQALVKQLKKQGQPIPQRACQRTSAARRTGS